MDMYRARFFGGKQARNLEGEGGKPSWKMEANNLAQNARDSTINLHDAMDNLERAETVARTRIEAIMKARKNAAYVAENRLAEEMHEAVDRATGVHYDNQGEVVSRFAQNALGGGKYKGLDQLIEEQEADIKEMRQKELKKLLEEGQQVSTVGTSNSDQITEFKRAQLEKERAEHDLGLATQEKEFAEKFDGEAKKLGAEAKTQASLEATSEKADQMMDSLHEKGEPTPKKGSFYQGESSNEGETFNSDAPPLMLTNPDE